MLVGTSLFSVLRLSLHLAEDAFHSRPGTFEAGPGSLTGILILAVLLTGPALLADRRSGRIIMLLGALSAMLMPAVHFTNGGNRSQYSDALLFIWGLIVLGANGLFSLILWLSELRRRSTSPSTAP